MGRNFSAHTKPTMGRLARKMRLPKRPVGLWRGPRGESWMKGEGLVPLPQSTGGNSTFIVVASEIRRSRMGLPIRDGFHGANDTLA